MLIEMHQLPLTNLIIVEEGTHFYREGIGSEFVEKKSGKHLYDFEMPDDPEEYSTWISIDLPALLKTE